MTSRYVALGIEASYGAGATPTAPLHITAATDPVDRGAMLEETISYPLYAAAYGGALKLSGTLEGVLRMPSMGLLFQGIFGAPSASVYSIVNFPKSLGMEVIDDSSGTDKCFKYVGVGISRAELTFASKDFVRTKWNFFAKDVTRTTPTLSAPLTFPEDKPGIFYGATVNLDSTPKSTIKTMNLSIDRKLDDDYFVVGHSKIQDLAIIGVCDMGGSITIGQKDWDTFNTSVFGSTGGTSIGDTTGNTLGQATFEVVCADPDGGGIATIAADYLCYLDASRNMQGRAGVDKTMNFKIVGDSLTVTDTSS